VQKLIMIDFNDGAKYGRLVFSYEILSQKT